MQQTDPKLGNFESFLQFGLILQKLEFLVEITSKIHAWDGYESFNLFVFGKF